MNEKHFSIHRILPFFVALLLVSLALCTPASAGLAVAGAKYMGEIAPGETYVHTITVSTKPTDAQMDIVIDVMGFGQGADRGYTTLTPDQDTGQYSARPWITLDASSFTLTPGGSKTVMATIVVPKDAGAGGRYAMIYIHNKPGGGGTTGVAAAIAVPVMVTIKGQPVTETGSIADIKAVTRSDGKTAIVTTFKNTGDHHYYGATDAVTVTGAGGKKVASVTLDPSATAIIPGATVTFEAVTATPLAPGSYTAESKVTLPSGTVLDTRTMTVEVAAGSSATVPTEPAVQVPAGTVTGAGTMKGGADIAGSPAEAKATYAPAPGSLALCTMLGVLLIVRNILKKT
jgi:hypothetical protein